MFGIGMPEMILILVIALIVIGPKKLPDLAKALGRAISEFKKATADFKETIEADYELKDVKKAFDEINEDLKNTMDLKTGYETDQNSKNQLEKEKTKRTKGSLKDE